MAAMMNDASHVTPPDWFTWIATSVGRFRIGESPARSRLRGRLFLGFRLPGALSDPDKLHPRLADVVATQLGNAGLDRYIGDGSWDLLGHSWQE